MFFNTHIKRPRLVNVQQIANLLKNVLYKSGYIGRNDGMAAKSVDDCTVSLGRQHRVSDPFRGHFIARHVHRLLFEIVYD